MITLQKQISNFKDNETYESSSFKDVDLVKLVERSNSIFQSLRKRKLITEEGH